MTYTYHVCIPLDGGGWYTVAICDTPEAAGAVLAALLPHLQLYVTEVMVRRVPVL